MLVRLKKLSGKLKRSAHTSARQPHAPNRITRRPLRLPNHPFARRPRIVPAGEDANKIISDTIIEHIDGAKLNARLLKDRVPVVIMEGPPLPVAQLRSLNKKYFGKVGWREAYDELGWVMVHDSVLVVWWDGDKGHFVFHCLSLSHRQFPEIALAEPSSSSCISKMLSGLDYVIGKHASSIRDGKKLRGALNSTPDGVAYQAGQVVKGSMAMDGWALAPTVPPKSGHEQSYAFYALKKGTKPEDIMPGRASHAVHRVSRRANGA